MSDQDKLLKHFSTFLNIDGKQVTRVSQRRYYSTLRQYIESHQEEYQSFTSIEEWASLFRQELIFIVLKDLLSKNYKITYQLNTFTEFQEYHLASVLLLRQQYRREFNLAISNNKIPFRDYLFAHLQEPCLQVSKKKYYQYKEKGYPYEIGDYFNWGVEYFAEVILKFNSKLSPNLSSYARYIISNRLIDKMRKVQKRNGHTPWSLLLCTEPKQLVKILENQGINQATREKYLLAWDYYKEIYQPTQKKISGKIQEPSEEKWKEIVKGYNSDPDSEIKVDIQTFKKWLLECGKAIYNFLSPEGKVTSIDEFIDEDGNTQLVEILPDDVNLTPDTYVGNQEIYDHFQEILESIYQNPTDYKPDPDKRKTLHPEIQQIAQMYFAQEKGQVEIAGIIYPPSENLSEDAKLEQNKKNQFKISRAISDLLTVLARKLMDNYREIILENLGKTKEKKTDGDLHNSLNGDDIANVCKVLKEWLKYYYDWQYLH